MRLAYALKIVKVSSPAGSVFGRGDEATSLDVLSGPNDLRFCWDGWPFLVGLSPRRELSG